MVDLPQEIDGLLSTRYALRDPREPTATTWYAGPYQWGKLEHAKLFQTLLGAQSVADSVYAYTKFRPELVELSLKPVKRRKLATIPVEGILK